MVCSHVQEWPTLDGRYGRVKKRRRPLKPVGQHRGQWGIVDHVRVGVFVIQRGERYEIPFDLFHELFGTRGVEGHVLLDDRFFLRIKAAEDAFVVERS